MQDPQGRNLVTIDGACKICGVARRTIYNWMKDGKIEYIRTAGNTVRIVEGSLWRYPEAPK